MKMNYNNWFDEQYGYQTGNRKGKVTYNDTKFVDINKRYKALVDAESELLNEQPFGVVGNDYGFDKLLDLMGRSNYTFEDINESLIDTYKVSLKNAMGSMLVNTQAVMFATSNVNKSNVASDKFTHYYIIDAPFNQLHFGDRDEFIRQKLQKMHSVDSEQYVSMSEFITSEISDILGFTIVCTVNGYICNDCKVAISDKGFKFKVGWPYSSDVSFIVYKLDESVVSKHEISSKYITDFNYIPYNALGNMKFDKDNLIGKKCIVNIYDNNFIKSVPSVVNFGTFTSTGFAISNIQQKTLNDISMNRSTDMTVVIYILKYFHEVPNVYPACNYYDITDSRLIYTEDGNKVTNENSQRIYASSTTNVNMLEKCTPPISLDRPARMSFKTILDCLDLYDNMIAYNDDIKTIGQSMSSLYDLTQTQFVDKIVRPLTDIYNALLKCYESYLKGSLLTSLVSPSLISKFKTFLTAIHNICNAENTDTASTYDIDEMHGDNYSSFVRAITSPFKDNILSNFKDLSDISYNYFENDNHIRFNRPVAEQCFISLKYNRIDGCWLFDYPNIKHFKGISNTFYIDDNSLNGDEVFKFFVLYTDTLAPSSLDQNIQSLTRDQIFDFDIFCNEVNKHMGYIRYYNIENKLMKMCEILYDKYDDEGCIQVLSRILKHKTDGEDILDIYPSNIDYEPSRITSDGINEMSDNSERGPFSINFLFYTLNMMYNNNDKLQTYFMTMLVDKKYNKRYGDIKIHDVVCKQVSFDVNYSQFSIAPNIFNNSSSMFPEVNKPYAYYGLPTMINNIGVQMLENPYRYVYNVYDQGIKYPLISYSSIDESKYVIFTSDMKNYGCDKYSYNNDIHICKLMTLYLSMIYDYISDLQTNYTKTFNQISTVNTCIKTVNTHIKTISDYINKYEYEFLNPNTINISNSIINDNEVINCMNGISQTISDIVTIKHNNRNITIFDFFNNIIYMLRNIYVTTGFDLYADKRIRKFYLYLKEINNAKSLYQYKKWINDFDADLLKIMDSLLAKNENYTSSKNVFLTFYNNYKSYESVAVVAIDSLNDMINNLSNTLFENHLNQIIEYCDDIIKNYIFDMFTVDDIKPELNDFGSYTSQPYLLSIELDIDSHFYPKTTDTVPVGKINLLFQPISEKINNSYNIINFAKITEYAIFDNTPIICDMKILDIDSNVLDTISVTINFNKVGNTADKLKSFKQVVNVNTTRVDIENIHEDIVIDDNDIVTYASNDMNYEMLLGNQFMQLPHIHQTITNTTNKSHGPFDTIIIENQILNNLINREYGTHSSKRMFFKPNQVLHIDIADDKSITSIGGKYFVGQTLYASSCDGKIIFPIIVTAIDHDISNGFIEAKVDYRNSKWFTIDDNEMITRYLKSPTECQVLSDNICNFINEYSNEMYSTYSNAILNNELTYSDDNFTNAWSMRGDPVYVQNNASYVYSRLNWIFNPLVPNRFIDEDSKKREFIYVGSGVIDSLNKDIEIKMINHDFNKFTDNELYPVLRQEPNDHAIWDLEIETFKNHKIDSSNREKILMDRLISLKDMMNTLTTEHDIENLMYDIEEIQYKINYEIMFQERMNSLILQLEQPTTWFNVRSYETAMVYISNGRAKTFPTMMHNIRDLTYSNKLDVFIYDWENKCWLNPNTYTIETKMIDKMKVDEYDDYVTNNVLYSITIKPLQSFIPSRKLLIYFSYDKSDIFNNIELNDVKFKTRFKPVLSLDNVNDDNMESGYDDPYITIRIRKHLDGTEKYVFTDYNKPDDFSIDNSFYIKRPIHKSGFDTFTPVLRMCDMKLLNGNDEYSHDKFDMYIRMPFKDVTTDNLFNIPKYECTIHQPIDSFIPNQIINLICIQNNEISSYNGNISNVTFTAITSYIIDENNNNIQHIDIVKSSLSNEITGDFICFINKSNKYNMFGSIITVTVSKELISTIDEMNNWFKVPLSLSTHREIPSECIFVPHDDVSSAVNKGFELYLSNKYNKNSKDIIEENNAHVLNPFEYYFDDINKKRIPISNIRQNNHDKRLVVNTETNKNIKLIKSTYISICRYSLQQIPQNGFIDLTGYIPTPLSRDRYEFWVNGRYINDPKDIIILSPTSIQLCNLKSLRNFELIELVEDINNSDAIRMNNVYIDLLGNTYSSFEEAILSNHNVLEQEIRFKYNIDQHQQIHDYTSDIITNPNNFNIEDDILDNIIQENTNDYNDLYNIPSINGISIQYITSTSIGITDIPSDQIISLLDEIWKCEQISNPLFQMTHRDGLTGITQEYVKLNVKPERDKDGSIIIPITGTSQKYFSLFISDISNIGIDNVSHTKTIIPCVRVGIEIVINNSYSGMWLCSTMPNCKPIKLI